MHRNTLTNIQSTSKPREKKRIKEYGGRLGSPLRMAVKKSDLTTY